jgi:hypothetical protein
VRDAETGFDGSQGLGQQKRSRNDGIAGKMARQSRMIGREDLLGPRH